MTTTRTEREPYSTLVGIDFSELGDLALERGCDLTADRRPSHLHVVHVETAWTTRMLVPSDVSEGAKSPPSEAALDLTETSARLHAHVAQRILAWCKARSSPLPFDRLTTHVRFAPAAEAIAQLAVDLAADLVVVGSNGPHGARRFFLGSVAEHTVRLAPCDVLVVRPPDATIPKIEAPCPRCVETRRATDGNELWCEEHRSKSERQYTTNYAEPMTSQQSGMLIHTSKRPDSV